MWIADGWKDYELLDCGGGEKLERWGDQILVRPDPQAIWESDRKNRGWRTANARYSRSSTGGGHWDKNKLPESWPIAYKNLRFQVKPMNFKHTGLFPEQAANWDFAMDQIRRAGRPIRVLNLFAYTGGATVACAKAGAAVCHVDAAKGMVAWAKDNARLSGLSDAPIRWIVDDCAKFVEREIRRLEKTGVPGTPALNRLLTARGTAPVPDGCRLIDLLRRPQVGYDDLTPFDPAPPGLPPAVREQVEITVKYEGYIRRQEKQVEEFEKLERRRLPPDMDYSHIQGLRLEAREKLNAVRPADLGQASRISGVSPADVTALMIYLER